MNPALLAALFSQIAVPELAAWLKSRHQAGGPLTDADILAKLELDKTTGIKIGEAWLAAHPAPDVRRAAPAVEGTDEGDVP